jgi:hypothetical protein
LDKRRNKMRDVARQHKAVNPQAASTDPLDDNMLGNSQLHGRGLKQEEIWEALGYGRVDRKPPPEIAKKQKKRNEKLSQVPAWRDMRVIKQREENDAIRKKRKMAEAAQSNAKDVPDIRDENGEKLTGVKRLINRIEKRATHLTTSTEPEKKDMYIGKEVSRAWDDKGTTKIEMES